MKSCLWKPSIFFFQENNTICSACFYFKRILPLYSACKILLGVTLIPNVMFFDYGCFPQQPFNWKQPLSLTMAVFQTLHLFHVQNVLYSASFFFKQILPSYSTSKILVEMTLIPNLTFFEYMAVFTCNSSIGNTAGDHRKVITVGYW